MTEPPRQHLDSWYLANLVCPRDRSALTSSGGALVCAAEHRYPVVDGIPVMLIAEAPETIGIAAASLSAATRSDSSGLRVDTLSLSDEERAGILALQRAGSVVDPVVAYLVAATNGMMYRHLIGGLTEYPIPELPMAEGHNRTLLDIGCSWGRWTLAAAGRGYQAVGIDPSLGAVLAARRVASALGRPARYVVGDARQLPFADGAFDAAYSYSVFQHFSYADAAQAVREIGRVVKPSGTVRVQMPTRFGLRCLYHQARRGFRAATGFEVRYWSWGQLRELFSDAIGDTRFEVDGFFGIGLQPADRALMTPMLRGVLAASASLKAASRAFPILKRLADSVFVDAVRATPRS